MGLYAMGSTPVEALERLAAKLAKRRERSGQGAERRSNQR
jgi:hypothetical protein